MKAALRAGEPHRFLANGDQWFRLKDDSCDAEAITIDGV